MARWGSIWWHMVHKMVIYYSTYNNPLPAQNWIPICDKYMQGIS